jgi:hypothetical protein
MRTMCSALPEYAALHYSAFTALCCHHTLLHTTLLCLLSFLMSCRGVRVLNIKCVQHDPVQTAPSLLHQSTLPYLVFPFLHLPYPTLPYLPLPYLILPYPTLPYTTVPYLTSPFLLRLILSYLALSSLLLNYRIFTHFALSALLLPHLRRTLRTCSCKLGARRKPPLQEPS